MYVHQIKSAFGCFKDHIGTYKLTQLRPTYVYKKKENWFYFKRYTKSEVPLIVPWTEDCFAQGVVSRRNYGKTVQKTLPEKKSQWKKSQWNYGKTV